MVQKYWDAETPMVADTGKNVLRYFAKAGRLQISNAFWTDGNGKQQFGKTVTLNLAAVAENTEAINILRTMLADIEKAAS